MNQYIDKYMAYCISGIYNNIIMNPRFVDCTTHGYNKDIIIKNYNYDDINLNYEEIKYSLQIALSNGNQKIYTNNYNEVKKITNLLDEKYKTFIIKVENNIDDTIKNILKAEQEMKELRLLKEII
jgi:hypothetical protein